MEFTTEQITIPEKLAADEKGEYQNEKEILAQYVNQMESAAMGATKKSKMTWFRLPSDMKSKLLDLYADMVCQLLGLQHGTNEELRLFLQTKYQSDHFRRAKDIVYSTQHTCILCIKSLRITKSEDGEEYTFRLQIQP